MLEPPKLADTAIEAALRAHYHMSIAALAFLPIGNDSATWVYRVEASEGAVYFLKLRAGTGFSVPSLAIPHYFAGQGVPHIVAPLPTIGGALWIGVGDFALSLYPFIDARPAAHAGMSERHWRALGATLKQVHSSQLPPELLRIVPRETFIPSRRDVLANLAAAVTRQEFTDPLQRELAAFWHARRDEIGAVIDRADALGRQLCQASPPSVLCHADLHTWNLLLDAEGQMWIVDWDETILAPKERDLMFVVGGIGRDLVRPHETACFLQGYAGGAIDQQALVYYRYAWAAQDMGAYGEVVFFSPDLGELTRRDALDGFTSLFEPGNIVDLALAPE